MGMIRKMSAISTMGLVSYRSPREKAADAMKQAARAQAQQARAQAKLAKAQRKALKAAQ